MEGIKQKLTKLRQEVEEAHDSVAAAKEEAAKAREDAERFQEEKDDLQRKLTILQDDLEKSEARADKMRMEADEKASTLDETERLLRKLTTNKDADYDEKESQIEEIRIKTDRIVELEKQVEEVNEIIDSVQLNGRIKLLEGDLEAAEDRNDKQTLKMASLENDLTEATNTLRERVVSDERSKKAEDNLEEQCRALKEKNAVQEALLETAERKITQLQHENNKLGDDLEESEQRYEDAKKELASTLAELNDI